MCVPVRNMPAFFSQSIIHKYLLSVQRKKLNIGEPRCPCDSMRKRYLYDEHKCTQYSRFCQAFYRFFCHHLANPGIHAPCADPARLFYHASSAGKKTICAKGRFFYALVLHSLLCDFIHSLIVTSLRQWSVQMEQYSRPPDSMILQRMQRIRQYRTSDRLARELHIGSNHALYRQETAWTPECNALQQHMPPDWKDFGNWHDVQIGQAFTRR